jgi:hypothetical protein
VLAETVCAVSVHAGVMLLDDLGCSGSDAGVDDNCRCRMLLGQGQDFGYGDGFKYLVALAGKVVRPAD